MNPLAKRRTAISPDEQRKAQEQVRQQMALAVSIAEKKTQAEVLEALQQITNQ